jgi:protein-S-isoprenylcysteine O-methyltransferase Ste14
MYGIPLTVLFASKYLFEPGVALPPNVVEFSFFGVGMGMDQAMLYGTALMLIGAALIIAGWYQLYRHTKEGGRVFVRSGLYRYSRHPQYAGFILLILGWLFGWPTILTLVFAPVLIYKYIKAARAEEGDMAARYGGEYRKYRSGVLFLI